MNRYVRAARRALAAGAATAAVLALTTAASAATQPQPQPSATRTPTAPARPAWGVTPTCRAADLGVWVAIDQGSGAAGTIFYPLQFTNLSKHSCILRGYPAVVPEGRTGAFLGRPARRSKALPVRTVWLGPGWTAHAVLGYSDVLAGACPAGDRVPAFELHVVPPRRHKATHALFGLDVCTTGPSVLTVSAIQPWPGTAGSI